MISVQEAAIFLLATGILGVLLGIWLNKKKIWVSVLFSGITLSLGMVILTYIIGIPGFVSFTGSLPAYLVYFIYLLFSLIYAGIWNVCLNKFIIYFKKIKIIDEPIEGGRRL
jgi:hypothetical protein